jgi:hypothetical protein
MNLAIRIALLAVPAAAAAAPSAELDCGKQGQPMGQEGVEAFCAITEPDGRVVQHGAYVRWHDPDHVAARGTYSHGKRSGAWTELDPSGALVTAGTYVDGLQQGLWRAYHPSGAPKSEGTYERGHKTGQWMSWSADGTSVVIGEYRAGERHGIWRDHEGAIVVRERMYRDGVLVSVTRPDPAPSSPR